MSESITGGETVQTTTAKNRWDDEIEVTSNDNDSFGEESKEKVAEIKDDKQTISKESSTVEKKVEKTDQSTKVESKEEKRNSGAEARIRELWQQKQDAEKREKALLEKIKELESKNTDKPGRNNFQSDEDYFDWMTEQKLNKRQIANELENARSIKQNVQNETFRLEWAERTRQNFETEEGLKEFESIVTRGSNIINSFQPEIHTYIQGSYNGPLVLKTILDHPDIQFELSRTAPALIFQKLNNLEAHLLNEKVREKKKVSQAPGPLGRIDNKVDIVSSSDDLPEDQWYDNYLKKKKKGKK